ncbi:unnamed protein product [Agarophyton chilense]|eukprot:gb/GEZJ01002223.1/.p1 GENE.gb/GEZJ01002223.1/~~gb/GEZJ01002223.1/.p1  ORF type:complete len:2531 (-),score=317.06 gb/GEZJ01002223.1/:1066-8658(-)
MKPPSRPRKRQRTSTTNAGSRPPEWTNAISSLLERLDTIHSRFTTVRDDHLRCIANIDERIQVRDTASRVSAKVSSRPAPDAGSSYAQSANIESKAESVKDEPRVPSSPLTLLLESEPPEKALREQSIIARAQAINRKNSELARERLPKQPEPMRNKTLHDYFLDEAAWLATDFIGERKWKMQMARKIAKMVVQYHNQQRRREARADFEEKQRIKKLAASIARDVSKFWRQIGEIAEYRAALKTKAQEDKERKSKLRELLQKTEAFSSELASSLQFHPATLEINDTYDVVKKVNFGERHVRDQDVAKAEVSLLRSHSPQGRSANHQAAGVGHIANAASNADATMTGELDSEFSDPMSVSGQGDTEAVDDETTMEMAEAGEKEDPKEISTLHSQAELPLQELLRSQGIDPDEYFSLKDKDKSPKPSESDSESCDPLSWDESVDDEETMRAAEVEDIPDVYEGQKLAEEAAAGIEEILRAQGIDPDVYRADQTIYLKPLNEPVDSTPSMTKPVCVSPRNNVKHRPGPKVALERSDVSNVVPDGQDLGSSTIASRKDMGPIGKETLAAEKNGGTTNGELTKTACESDGSQPDSRSNTASNSLDVETNGTSEKKKSTGIGGHDESDSSHFMNGRPCAGIAQTRLNTRLPKELLRGNLRDYQKRGLDWLLTLWRKNLNGILADEMGLGKTIQTIALLAWLAVEKEVWGPHLIVVPTSVMVNWEVEFKKWLPGFKVLTYFGSVKERKEKRRGWTRPDMFHVCITSYTLAVQDSLILRRKKWYYLILDEAHNIKNFESQRWQTLLTFSSRHRLLLTGTPLQNSVMELWSLMHFLMPNLFESHSWFKDTFWKPLIEAVEAEKETNRGRSETVSTLHGVLRPFLLRRLKADVEKGLPPKTEHVVHCRLSKRQRQLYEDFMARNDTRETLQSGDFFGVMNVLMQLRKVCNHPDLFEGRAILSPFSCNAIFYPVPTMVARAITEDVRHRVTLRLVGLDFQFGEKNSAGSWYEDEITRISAVKVMREDLKDKRSNEAFQASCELVLSDPGSQRALSRKVAFRRAALHHQVLIHALRIRQRALLGQDLRRVFTMSTSSLSRIIRANNCTEPFSEKPRMCLVHSIEDLAQRANPIAHRFVCCITRAIAPCIELRFYGDDMLRLKQRDQFHRYSQKTSRLRALFREFEVRSHVTIPDKRLVQWDCGKLQTLERLIHELRARKSRALIFTQMTRMLDILESFLNLHCCRYLRLDGTTKTDDRQKVVERFNVDSRIFCMILTTRAGGVGLNLTGADTVIFYDSDYNPAIDNQAQDRAHRIGQTRPVRVYRLISEQTVEESILKRAMQKRNLEQQVISQAGFTTDAIRRIREPPTTGSTAEKPRVRGGCLLSANVETPGAVKNGLRSTSETRSDKRQHSVAINGKNVLVSEKPMTPSEKGVVQSSGGEFTGFRADDVIDIAPNLGRMKGESMEYGSGADKDLSEYQAVASKLLAREDEREGMALQAAEKERKDLEAEFKDSSVEDRDRFSTKFEAHSKDTKDLTRLLDALTPIQRYALRVLERVNYSESFTQVEYSGIVPQLLNQEKESPFESNPSIEAEKNSDSESTGEDDTETLLYEVDVTEEGQTSYLKALTDADADIDLYLPLRDGGPEELKFSTVVHGTAAAGLECAEDAAFFPHAYNRMSRTMYATRRQKEKGLENLRKRKAEIEVKRKHEVSTSVSNQASSLKAHSAESCREDARRPNHLEKTKVSKGKSETSRYPSTNVPSKKQRVDSGPKSRSNLAIANTGSGSESYHASMGLFTKKPKKNTRRITVPGMKSSIAFYGGNISSEHQGVNDEWTKEEDEALIAAASACNNNMFFVSDLLSSQAMVRIGVRRFRSLMHCVDRLLNVLGKDVKNGPLLPKSTSSDADAQRKYQEAFQSAIAVSRGKCAASVGTGQAPPEQHPSHQKLLSEAASKMKGMVRPELLPPIPEVLSFFEVPEHHKPGFKTHETARQGLLKRKPFMFPPRDDLRGRGNGLTGTVSGSQPDQSTSALKNAEQHCKERTTVHRTANKGIRTQNPGTSHLRSTVPTRLPGPPRSTPAPQAKPVDVKSRGQVVSHRTQQAGNVPPVYSAPSRKTSGLSTVNVTVYHQPQPGGARQLPTTGQKIALGQKAKSGHSVSVKQGAGSTSMLPGTKFSSPGTPNVRKLPAGGGKVSNGSLNKSSAAIVQSMGSTSVPQNGDGRMYPIGSHAVLPANVGKLVMYGGGRGGDRPYATQTTSGIAPAREPGTMNGGATRVNTTSSRTGTGRGYSEQAKGSAASVRGLAIDRKGTIPPNGNLGVVRSMPRGGVSRIGSRGISVGRTASAIGRGGSTPRIMAPNLTASGRGNTVIRGSVGGGTVLIRGRGRGMERGKSPSRAITFPKVGATQGGNVASRGNILPRGNATTRGLGSSRAMSIGGRGMGTVGQVSSSRKTPTGAATGSGASQGLSLSSSEPQAVRPQAVRPQAVRPQAVRPQAVWPPVSASGSAPIVSMGSAGEGKSERAQTVSLNSAKVGNAVVDSSAESKK